MKMKQKNTIAAKYFLLTLAASGLLCASGNKAFSAQEDVVTIYGQPLKPGLISFPDSDYTWDDLKNLVPKLLPDAQTSKLSAEETCDHIVKMTDLYLIQVDEASNDLAFKMGKILPESAPNSYTDPELELSKRLISRSPKALNELLVSMPKEQSQIIVAKDLTLKSLALILLHDAALANCEAHAKLKEYNPITTYDGDDAEIPTPAPASAPPAEPAQE